MRTTDTIAACVLLCVASCGKPASPRASEPAVASAHVDAGSAAGADVRGVATPARPEMPGAPPTPSVAKPSVFHPDDDPACADLPRLTSAIYMSRVAANPQPHSRKARALWPTLPPACRGSTFFLAAAQLVGQADDAKLPTADGTVVVQSPTDALARGLAAEPDHPRLLAHLAFADDLVPDQAPPLPDGACARAKARGGTWIDYAAYVCALAAIHAGDGPAALTEIKRIHDVAEFPDLDARHAQALALVGKRKEARTLAKSAVAALARVWRFDVTDAAISALKKKLAAL